MVLVFAAAIGLAFMHESIARVGSYRNRFPFLTVSYVSLWFDAWSSPWLVAMTFAALIVRLRRPRPPMRRLSRQPGLVATTLGALFLTFGAISYFYMIEMGKAVSIPRAWLSQADWALLRMTTMICPCVVGGWVAMLIFGRLRRERGWIDGLGILVGCGWTSRYLLSILNDIWMRW